MSDRSTQRDTRDRILIAAATMLGEDPTARLSVRGVAARAGVSTGSLRHFFPTQRELVETVVAGLYDIEIPDDPIYDTERTPADRLVACLRLLLAEFGAGDRARERWRAMYESYIASGPSEEESAVYLALERLGLRRIERWLTVLIEEGAIPAGKAERRARFLTTVLNGLVTERALPANAMRFASETETLQLAVAAVIGDTPATGQSAS
ncbi:TetR/AcrR family transcriptional regulator (plasmid) [Prescottella equi]|uniref:TetR/AcrR family transcriptional regulator n=1 Tax=Rhodococcus hoagii TaxID=43767 RepID=UPI002577B7F3|nr:TetR/AcrR family transcriptional regulator [Prescottella equi]WJJ14397.1 TetR/AcrR family transcriptional regulator [Prescottella equi]